MSTLNWSLLSAEEKSTMSITLQMETIKQRQIDAKVQAKRVKAQNRTATRRLDKGEAVDEMFKSLQSSDLPGLVFINRSDVNYVPVDQEKEDLVVYINVSACDKPVRVFFYSANNSINVSNLAERLHDYYDRIDSSKCHERQVVMTGVDFDRIERMMWELERMV